MSIATAEDLGVDTPHCALACIYGLLRHQGETVNLDDIKARMQKIDANVDFNQVSLSTIRRTLESYGYSARSARVSAESMSQSPTPAILYLRPDKIGSRDEIGHVILLFEIADGRATIGDFSVGKGKKNISLERLKTFWDGELIFISSPAAQPKGSVRFAAWYPFAVTVLAIISTVLLYRTRYLRTRYSHTGS